MNWVSLYTNYLFKFGLSVKAMGSTPSGVITGSSVVAASVLAPEPVISAVQKALGLLFIFFVLDFITGILASRVDKKKAEKLDPTLKEQSLISSEKLKLSAVKAFTYASAILGVWAIETVFFIKTFSFTSVSTEKMTVTLIFVGFCCAIEFYSIVFENFKRMGFDIAKKFILVVKNIKKIIFQVEK